MLQNAEGYPTCVAAAACSDAICLLMLLVASEGGMSGRPGVTPREGQPSLSSSDDVPISYSLVCPICVFPVGRHKRCSGPIACPTFARKTACMFSLTTFPLRMWSKFRISKALVVGMLYDRLNRSVSLSLQDNEA